MDRVPAAIALSSLRNILPGSSRRSGCGGGGRDLRTAGRRSAGASWNAQFRACCQPRDHRLVVDQGQCGSFHIEFRRNGCEGVPGYCGVGIRTHGRDCAGIRFLFYFFLSGQQDRGPHVDLVGVPDAGVQRQDLFNRGVVILGDLAKTVAGSDDVRRRARLSQDNG